MHIPFGFNKIKLIFAFQNTACKQSVFKLINKF